VDGGRNWIGKCFLRYIYLLFDQPHFELGQNLEVDRKSLRIETSLSDIILYVIFVEKVQLPGLIPQKIDIIEKLI
jgi:hypothetical protein